MATTGGAAAALVAVAAALAVVVVTIVTRLCAVLVWRPYAVARAFARQGVHGPPYRFLVGNSREVHAIRAATSAGHALDRTSHDYIPRVMPHYRAWMSAYGKVFLTWSGATPTLVVGSHDMAKRVLLDSSGLYGKTDPGPAIRSFIGRTGLPLIADGDAWSRHRRVVRPAFAADRLKTTMTSTMVACAAQLVRAWEARCAAVPAATVVEVGQGLRELTADVIARTAFGRSCHGGDDDDDDDRQRQVKDVFVLQRQLQLIAVASIGSSNDSVLPGVVRYYLPTRANLRRWRLERALRRKIRAIIDDRLAIVAAADATAAKEEEEVKRRCYGTDLLGHLLAANTGDDDGSKRHVMMSMEEIIDECQTFFFAGHDTTSHLITWAMFLLATHPEWQERLREEVLRECGGVEREIDADGLNKLKLVTMVLHETLRLYGGVTLIARRATADVADLCGVEVPRGTVLVIPIAMLHRDEEAWGADAAAFDPLRFFQRDGGRARPNAAALLSFSLGPRACMGQGFAMMEAKATLALVLRRFEFEVAPEYVHAPVDLLTLQPSNGLPLVLKLLD